MLLSEVMAVVDAIIYSAILTFVIIGIIACLFYVMLRILQPNKKEKYSVILIAREGDKDAASKLSSAGMRVSLIGDSSRAKIIMVDYGMDKEERRLCENICRTSKGLYLCEPEEVTKYIEGMY
jgi:hypothetical protein